jgi:hypothetical protein
LELISSSEDELRVTISGDVFVATFEPSTFGTSATKLSVISVPEMQLKKTFKLCVVPTRHCDMKLNILLTTAV